MHRTLIAAGLLVGGLGLAVPAGLAAAADTTPTDIPTECLSPAPPAGQNYYITPPPGPSRRPHIVETPSCDEIPEICVILVPGADAVAPERGPARRPHGDTSVPCADAEPACTFTIEGAPGQVIDLTPDGPSRRPHGQVQTPDVTVEITAECQEYIASLALPPTGGSTTPLVLGAALVVGGGLLIAARRRHLAA